MKSFLLLLKLSAQTLWGSLTGDGLKKPNGKWNIGLIVLYAFAGLSFLTLAGLLIYLEVALYDLLAVIGLERLLIGIAIMLSMVVTLMFGIPQSLAALYLSKDTPALAHLPLGQRTIMTARWMEVYLSELLITAGFLLPLVVMNGLHSGLSAWVGSFLAMLTVPVFPLAVCLVLASILGRLSSLTRHKDAWIAIGSLIMVGVVLAIEWTLMPQIPDHADAAFFLKLLTDNEAVIELVIGSVPPVLWAVRAMQGSWMHVLLLLAASVGGMALLIFLLGGDYLAVCLRHTEQAKRKPRRRNRNQGEKDYAPRSPLAAIYSREMNEVLRVPTYFINGAMGVLMPAIMLMGASVGVSSSDGAETMNMVLIAWNGLSSLDQTLIFAAIMSLLCWIDTLPATCISREGKRLQITRMIPVPAITIVKAKLLVSLTFNAIGGLMMCAAAAILLGAAYIPQLAAAFVLVNLLSYVVSVANMAADVIKPSFNWKNETEAVKQNMNSMIGMLFSTMVLALLIAPTIIWLNVTRPWMRLAFVCALLTAMCAAAYVLLRRLVAPRYARLEP